MIGEELRFSSRFSLPVSWVGGEKDTKHVLYRLYTETDDLLYVGITTNLLARMRSHRQKVFWWDFVDYVVAESCENLYEAQSKEITAIASERPEHNLIWNFG